MKQTQTTPGQQHLVADIHSENGTFFGVCIDNATTDVYISGAPAQNVCRVDGEGETIYFEQGMLIAFDYFEELVGLITVLKNNS